MIAVTTRSRAKGVRYTLPLLLAGRRIGRGLQRTPGCERYANVIAGPREVWTLSIWTDPLEMRKCMRDGVHGRVMWQQPYWLDCYWGMRWSPADYRLGNWTGDPWHWPDWPAPEPAAEPAGAVAGLPTWMQDALGHTVPLTRRQVAGTAGATYRLRVPPWRLLAALRDLHRLRRIGDHDPDAFKLSLGFGTGAALYLLVIANSADALERLRRCPEHEHLVRRWGDRLWVSSWTAESEFGHWDGDKLREGRLAAAPLLLDVELPAQLHAATRAREALRAGLPVLDRDLVADLELLSSEVVANNVRHAQPRPTDRIGLQVRATADWIRVEVTDHGRRFEPHVPMTTATRDASGRGLYILNQTADRWGIIDGPPERRTWFEMRLPSR